MPNRTVEILLIEDDPDDRALTIRALVRNNLANRIVTVSDGAEALEFLFGTGRHAGRSATDLPGVILLDLKLPLVSGIDVLRAVKADPRLARAPVVVLTSSREDSDLTTCYDLGANSYIVKPVDFEKFTDAVRTVGLYWLLLNEPPLPAPAVPATGAGGPPG